MTVIDVNVPRFNQLCVAVLTGLAFVLQLWALVAVTLVLVAATRFGGPRFAVFTAIYVRFIRPRLSETTTEDAAPPRFAQLLGVIVLGAAVVAFVAGASTIGWALTLVVTSLATLAAATRICAGCVIYEKAIDRP